jgi:hypothetical protein
VSNFLKIAAALILSGFLLNSCRKAFETSWDVDIAAPIARSTLNINNFFGDSLFQTDPTGLLHLAFSKKIAGFKLDSLIEIPDTTIIKDFPLFDNFTVTPGMQVPGFPQTQDIDFKINNGIELRKAIIKDGHLQITYSNTFTQPLDFELTLPSATKWGIPFQIKETIPPGVNSLPKSYDISGFTVLLTGMNNNKSNTIPQTVNIKVSPNAQTASTYSTQSIKAEISYKDLLPYYLEGYFGEQQLDLPYDSVSLNISNSLQASNLQINSAFINFKIVNEFGVDVNAQLGNIKSVNTFSNSSITLNASGLSNVNINRASKTSQQSNPVFPSVKTISVNTSNSNLKPFLENLPDYLTYSGKIVINPLGNVSGSNDFAFYNTGVSIYADVDMPLQLQANYFRLINFASIDLSKVNQLDDINSGNIVLQATNGFPFDAVMQGYILDENKTIIDSLFSNPGNKIDRGIIDANYIVTQPVYTKIMIPLTPSKIQNLKKSKSVKFVSQFNLPQPQPPDIKILDNYSLDVVLGIDVNYRARKK